METKELKIEAPDGFEIDKENSSFEKIVFKKKEKAKPRSWEEYCQLNVGNKVCWYIDGCSIITPRDMQLNSINHPNNQRNLLPTKSLAHAFLAYMQLISLRQAWVGDWKPDWLNEHVMKYCINVASGKISTYYKIWEQNPLSFPTGEMAEDFKNCFIDLLEIAKPLI